MGILRWIKYVVRSWAISKLPTRGRQTVLIRIDRSSVRLNDKSVASSFAPVEIVPAGRTIRFDIKSDIQLVDNLNQEPYPGIRVTSIRIASGNKTTTIYTMMAATIEAAQSFSDWLVSKGIKHDLDISSPFQPIFALGGGSRPAKWLYAYEDPSFVCYKCGMISPVSYLREDWVHDDDDTYQVDNVCPHCGTADCVEVVHESLEDVLGELGLQPRAIDFTATHIGSPVELKFDDDLEEDDDDVDLADLYMIQRDGDHY